MNLFIRSDADGRIGAGHVMRCIALAQAWQDQGGHVTFISRCESDGLRERIRGDGFRLICLDRACPDSSDVVNTLSVLKNDCSRQKPWLVLDGYHFTTEYQNKIRKEGIHLLVVDDTNHLPHYHADILLNQNTHAADLKYSCDEDTTCLLGTRYVLLRREFLKYRRFKREIPDRAKNILVTLGGADPDNVTLKVIEALELLDEPGIAVKIITGPANLHGEMLRRILTSVHFEAELLSAPPNMPELMAWADIAVSAAGSTCWELAFMGVPGVVLVLAENQVPVAEYLMNKKAVLSLGVHGECSRDHIRDICRKMIGDRAMRVSLSGTGTALVDGLGSSRVMKSMQSMRTGSIMLREVAELDRELVWGWTNDQETRKASYSQAYIPWDEHIRWFDSIRKHNGHRFYIASNGDGKPVGQIRFAMDGKGATLSFSVAPEARGRGYAREILVEAARRLFDETEIEEITAYVKSDNVLSLRAFHRAGFLLAENVVLFGVESCKMILGKPNLS